MRRSRPRRGVTYLALLFGIAILGVLAGAAADVHLTNKQREAEHELLRIGAEFRAAIASYAAQSPRGAPQYPRQLEDLLRDPRLPTVRRHLRRIYADPVTGKREWGLLRHAGGIIGVHSLAREAPLKVAGFDPPDTGFESAGAIADWLFVPGGGPNAATRLIPVATRDVYRAEP